VFCFSLLLWRYLCVAGVELERAVSVAKQWMCVLY